MTPSTKPEPRFVVNCANPDCLAYTIAVAGKSFTCWRCGTETTAPSEPGSVQTPKVWAVAK